MSDITSFGYWVRRRRKVCDLTQEDLARQVGCAAVTIRKIEADVRRPSTQVAERLADALGIPDDERAAFLKAARAELAVDRLATPTDSPVSPPAPHLRGTREQPILKGYALHEQVGAGGFGVVYRAEQTTVGREVAVKIVLPQYANHPDFIRRFEAEAQMVARLEHPHIVPLYDYWREPGRAYLVMRYMRGGSLRTVLNPWTLDALVRLIEQLAPALALAHRQGIVHRDLKPANILLDEEGNAYLADFGIAKELEAAHGVPQTPSRAVVASPAYLSPEQIRNEPVTLQADIYSFGVMLYALLIGAPRFGSLAGGERLVGQLHEPLPSLGTLRPDLPAGLNAVIQRATAEQPADRYPDMFALLEDVRRAVAAPWRRPLLALPATPRVEFTPAVNTPVANPYKGLRAFQEADAADFFGREALTRQLLSRMGEVSDLARFLAVVGPSGSGKSSAVRAGLIPALRQGALPGSAHWFVVDVLPGTHPLEEIEAALLRVAVNPPPSLLEQLQTGERGLLRAVKRVLPGDDSTELVLVIDQFEEIFTLVADETVRAHVLNSLVTAVLDERSRLRVVVTLRADFTDRPLQYVDFGEVMRERATFVLPLTPDELERAITEPARRAGVTLEPELVTTIVRDVGAQPGTLPLLQYAMTELFERRVVSGTDDPPLLTRAAYEASGGVAGALTRRADELYTRLDARSQEAARQLFLRLVTPGEGVEETRRRVRLSELASADANGDWPPVVDLYGRARLLTFDRDPLTREPVVEMAHEVLIHAWGRLRAWLDSSRENLRVQRRLSMAATEWASAGGDPSFLATGARLAQFEALAGSHTLAINPTERAYLDASLAEREWQQQAEQERRERELAQAQALAEEQRVRAETEQRRANEQAQAAGRLRLAVLAATLFARSAQANFIRAEAQRLAAEANRLVQAGDNAEVIALLAIRSLNTFYTPQGDAALQAAATFEYAERILSGHTAGLWDVTFSPDGRYVLTGSYDHTARLWDAQTGQELRVFAGHSGWVTAVAFAPTGRHMLTAGSDATARLWDVERGDQMRAFTVEGRPEMKMSAAFSPDGRFVLARSGDDTGRLWDIETRAELRIFHGHTDRLSSVAFSQDGRMVLTGSWDQTARLWDAHTGAELRTYTGHTAAIASVAFSPDGQTVLTGGFDTTARLWATRTGAELRQFRGHTDFVHTAKFSPDGRYVLTGSDDKSARLWDSATGALVRRFSGHTASVWSVAFSPDGRRIVTGSLDGTARVWTLQSGAERLQLGSHDGPLLANSVVYSRDGNYVLTGANATIRLWDVRSGEERRRFTHTPGVYNVAFPPDSRSVLAGAFDGAILRWDAQTGELLQTLSGHTTVIAAVQFSPDGKYILSSDVDGIGRLWEAETGRELHVFAGPRDDIAFSADGQYVLASTGKQNAQLLAAPSGQLLRTFAHPDSADVIGVAFSPDGRSIALGSMTGTISVLDTETGRHRRSLTGHSNEVWALAFSPDGRTILSGSIDGTARLWDAATGAERRRFDNQPAAVYNAVFSPDGRRVLIGDSTGVTRLFDTDYHDTIRSLCDRLLRDFSEDERRHYNIGGAEPTCTKR